MYKGVKPMFEHLGFTSPAFNKPGTQVYWKNHIPTHFNYFNLSGVEVRIIETDSDVGVSTGAKTSRESYMEIFIDEDMEQVWDDGYYYPVLPRLNKFGAFDEDVDVTLYGGENPPITNLDEEDENLILDLNFNESDTDDIIDKLDKMKVSYNNDFELKLDDNLRLFNSTDSEPDPIQKIDSEQAF
tara:strand:- start:95 stop:649 length:555 start_codon:yes stop_codon:yes gene_type:complete